MTAIAWRSAPPWYKEPVTKIARSMASLKGGVRQAPRSPARRTPAGPGSERVEYGTDDAGARIAQLADDACRVGKTGAVLAGEHQYAARAESHALRIRVEFRRGCIEQDDVELVLQLLQ